MTPGSVHACTDPNRVDGHVGVGALRLASDGRPSCCSEACSPRSWLLPLRSSAGLLVLQLGFKAAGRCLGSFPRVGSWVQRELPGISQNRPTAQAPRELSGPSALKVTWLAPPNTDSSRSSDPVACVCRFYTRSGFHQGCYKVRHGVWDQIPIPSKGAQLAARREGGLHVTLLGHEAFSISPGSDMWETTWFLVKRAFNQKWFQTWALIFTSCGTQGRGFLSSVSPRVGQGMGQLTRMCARHDPGLEVMAPLRGKSLGYSSSGFPSL